MLSRVNDAVFSEPSGQPVGAIQLCGAFFFAGLYLYIAIVERSTVGSWPLVMTLAFACSGLAESLPKTRRRAAGVLRLTGLIVLLCGLAAIVFAPELITA